MNYVEQYALRLPNDVVKHIVDEGLIEMAIPTGDDNGAMMFLFDVFEKYLDNGGDFDDWHCPKCRKHIYDIFVKIHPYLQHRVTA